LIPAQLRAISWRHDVTRCVYRLAGTLNFSELVEHAIEWIARRLWLILRHGSQANAALSSSFNFFFMKPLYAIGTLPLEFIYSIMISAALTPAHLPVWKGDAYLYSTPG
jgi:hypothetical protein